MEGAQPSWPSLSAPPAALLLGTFSLIFGTVFFGGASGDGSVVWVGGFAAVLAAAALAAVSLGLLSPARLELPTGLALAALAGLVAWCGISIAWSIAGDHSWAVLNKGIVYLCFVALGLVLTSFGTSTTRAIAGLLSAVLSLALIWALAGRAIPALAPDDTSRLARLHSPVGYSNGLALLADGALVLGLWLALASRRSVRTTGFGVVYVAVLAGLLTSSRAGVVAGVVVLALWLWLGPRRLESSVGALAAGAPAVAIAAWSFTRPALVDPGQSHTDRVNDGAVFGALALAGLGVVLVLTPRAVAWALPRHARTVRRALIAGAVAAVVIGLAAFAIAAGNPFTKAVHGFSRGECVNTSERFGSLCTNNRLEWWREAWHVFAADPSGGAGAGTFEIARTRYRKSGSFVREPHSVPLQVLAGTGVPGAALLLVLVTGAAIAFRRALARVQGEERFALVAAVALPVAWGVHALVDYDLDYLALTAPTLLAAAAIVGAGRPPVTLRLGLVPGLTAVAVAATVVVSFALPWLADRRVAESNRAHDAENAAAAIDAARSAHSLDPLAPQPLSALGEAYLLRGDLADARAAYKEETKLQPENAATWYELGLFEFLWTRNYCAAYQALNHSYTLDPNSTHWTKGGELDQAAAAVNDPDNPACGR
jgi:hypothetical protein